MPEQVQPNRRGQFGQANPAFALARFKRTINILANEEFADALKRVLDENESAKGQVPPFLYEFNSQLTEALDQPPPAKGEKPAVLAPGKPGRLPRPAA